MESPYEFKEEVKEEVKDSTELQTHHHIHTHTHTHTHKHKFTKPFNFENKNQIQDRIQELTNNMIDFTIASNNEDTFISIVPDKSDIKGIEITIGEESLRNGFKIHKNSIVKEIAIFPTDRPMDLDWRATDIASRKLNKSREKCESLYDVYNIKDDVAEYDGLLGLYKKAKIVVLKLTNLKFDLDYDNDTDADN